MNQGNFFELYPIRNPKIHWEDNCGTLTLVFLRDGLGDKLLCRIFNSPRVIRVELDEMGSLAWQKCDGQTPIHAIVSAMRRKFGAVGEPVPERLTVFLRTLRERGWIKIAKEAGDAN